MTAQDLEIDLDDTVESDDVRTRPGDWLEHSPILTIGFGLVIGGWMVREFAGGDPILVISNLNTYNLLFLTLGMLLHWRPRNFLRAVARAVPATSSILIQFPFYAGIAAVMTRATDADGNTLAHYISDGFVNIATVGVGSGEISLALQIHDAYGTHHRETTTDRRAAWNADKRRYPLVVCDRLRCILAPQVNRRARVAH